MGMRIPSSGAAQGVNSNWQAQRQSFSQLSQALQSGDLGAAQSAFAAITRNQSAAPDPNSPLGKLGQALQSGDVSQAQQAFAAMRASGHHHHHAAAAPAASAPTSATTGVGSVISVSA